MTPVPFRLQWFSTLVPARTAGPILEVGCGGGQLLALLARRCPRAAITGIDRSALQARRAQALLAALPAARPAVAAVALEEAASTLGAPRFGLVLAMNVNAFWTEPARAGEAVRALLAPRGRVLLGFEPPTARGRAALQARVHEALPAMGFAAVGMPVPAAPASGAFAVWLRRARAGR